MGMQTKQSFPVAGPLNNGEFELLSYSCDLTFICSTASGTHPSRTTFPFNLKTYANISIICSQFHGNKQCSETSAAIAYSHSFFFYHTLQVLSPFVSCLSIVTAVTHCIEEFEECVSTTKKKQCRDTVGAMPPPTDSKFGEHDPPLLKNGEHDLPFLWRMEMLKPPPWKLSKYRHSNHGKRPSCHTRH